MKVLTRELVSNSDIIKSYKACRKKAGKYGKIIILKNNKPDAVLFSIKEYERFSLIVERLEKLEDADIAKVTESIPKGKSR